MTNFPKHTSWAWRCLATATSIVLVFRLGNVKSITGIVSFLLIELRRCRISLASEVVTTRGPKIPVTSRRRSWQPRQWGAPEDTRCVFLRNHVVVEMYSTMQSCAHKHHPLKFVSMWHASRETTLQVASLSVSEWRLVSMGTWEIRCLFSKICIQGAGLLTGKTR
jgi:hypothetical protein